MNRVIAFSLLILLMPLFVVIGAIQLWVFKKIFFCQLRTGKGGRNFTIFKFQSLFPRRKPQQTDEERMGKWGQFLRRTSLDELPQLINIIKGEMNFVGPRPLLPEYLPLYNEKQRKRHKIKPGITGWAQVQGRNELSWEEQFELDTWYVENRCFGLDAKILKRTLLRMWRSPSSEVFPRKTFMGK